MSPLIFIVVLNTSLTQKTDAISGTDYQKVTGIGYDETNKKLMIKVGASTEPIPFSGSGGKFDFLNNVTKIELDIHTLPKSLVATGLPIYSTTESNPACAFITLTRYENRMIGTILSRHSSYTGANIATDDIIATINSKGNLEIPIPSGRAQYYCSSTPYEYTYVE